MSNFVGNCKKNKRLHTLEQIQELYDSYLSLSSFLLQFFLFGMFFGDACLDGL